MTPIDWAKRPIQKYADFSGRAPRAEYWWFYLAILVAYLVTMIVDSLIGIKLVGPYGPLTGLLGLALIIPSLAVTVRRLHDTNRSGWWMLIVIVPYFVVGFMLAMAAKSGDVASMGAVGIVGIIALIGVIALLVFMVLPGTQGDNRFGPDPYAGEVG